MRVETGFIPAQSLALPAFVKNSSFSKDAEIAQKVIEFATNGSSVSDVFAIQTGIELTASGLKSLPIKTAAFAARRNFAENDFDGFIIGADGNIFAPSTPLKDVPAVLPQAGAKNDETLVYINGVSTTRERQTSSLQSIADATGSPTIGIHNATRGGLLDVKQSSNETDKTGDNPAVETLAQIVYSELDAGREAHLIAHSQGAILTGRALQNVLNRLRLEDCLSKKDAENLLAAVKVEIFGGAARRYPDGPKYVHYVNCKDLVPQLFGLREFLNPYASDGRDAIVHYFSAGSGFLAHGLEDIYLRERVSLESLLNSFNH